MTRKSGKHCAQHTEPLEQCLPDFLVMVIQFVIYIPLFKTLKNEYLFIKFADLSRG